MFLGYSYCYAEYPHPSVIPVIEQAKTIFPGGVAILSNSVGSSDDDGYSMAIHNEATMGIPVIRHRIKKPGCLKEVIDHFEQSMKRRITPNQICVVGDRLLTDVVFANMYGMTSVLVEPLTFIRDHPGALIVR